MLSMFALTALDNGEKIYMESSKEIVGERYNGLFSTLAVEEDNGNLNDKYYFWFTLWSRHNYYV